MSWTPAAVLAALAVISGAPAVAHAQTPGPGFGPMGGRLRIGGIGAAGSVRHVGAVGGAELAFEVTDRFELVGEALWMQDAATRRYIDRAQTVVAYLHSSQGGSASGTVTAPATYGGGGVRYMLPRAARVRPYLTVGAGAAHVALQPRFTLNGSDITAVLPDFGVIVGRDLTGETTRSAFGGGGGVRLLNARWYLDASARLTSIRTPSQATNVVHVGGTIGVRF